MTQQIEATDTNETSEERASIINAEKINTKLQQSLALIFFGFLITGLFMLIYEQNTQLALFGKIAYPLFCIAGCAMMAKGVLHILFIKKIGVYLKVIAPEEPMSITRLQDVTQRTQKTIRQDFQKFFEQELLYGEIIEESNQIFLHAPVNLSNA